MTKQPNLQLCPTCYTMKRFDGDMCVRCEWYDKQIPKYDKKSFRTVRHGIEEENGYCRGCNLRFADSKKAYRHAKTSLHTVDVYREHWIEYTSFVKQT